MLTKLELRTHDYRTLKLLQPTTLNTFNYIKLFNNPSFLTFKHNPYKNLNTKFEIQHVRV